MATADLCGFGALVAWLPSAPARAGPRVRGHARVALLEPSSLRRLAPMREMVRARWFEPAPAFREQAVNAAVGMTCPRALPRYAREPAPNLSIAEQEKDGPH